MGGIGRVVIGAPFHYWAMNITPIFLIGAPGSGKTTQGARIAERLQIPHVSMGEEIRRRRSEGQRMRFDAGGLLSEDDTKAILISVMAGALRVVIDGIPRTAAQVELLQRMGVTSARVIEYGISFDDAMSRMRGRGRDGEDPGVIARRHSEHGRRSYDVLGACREAGWRVHLIDGGAPLAQVSEQTDLVLHLAQKLEA